MSPKHILVPQNNPFASEEDNTSFYGENGSGIFYVLEFIPSILFSVGPP
jgi:hypothetical protein